MVLERPSIMTRARLALARRRDRRTARREARALYNLDLVDEAKLVDLDAVVLAVAHREFVGLTRERFDRLFAPGVRVLLDVKGVCDRADYESAGYVYWRL